MKNIAMRSHVHQNKFQAYHLIEKIILYLAICFLLGLFFGERGIFLQNSQLSIDNQLIHENHNDGPCQQNSMRQIATDPKNMADA